MKQSIRFSSGFYCCSQFQTLLLLSFNLVFHFIQAESNFTIIDSNQEPANVSFPIITIVDVKYYTTHNHSGNNTLIHNTFRSLTLQCNAPYPTTWKFFKPVYQDPTLKSISISSRRVIDETRVEDFFEACAKRNDDNCSSTFISNLTLNFKYVDEFPKLLCRSSKLKDKTNHTKSTYVNVTVYSGNSLYLNFSFTHSDSEKNDTIYNDYSKTENDRVGFNENCSLKLYFNKKKQEFDCGWADNNGTRWNNASDPMPKPIPTIISCSNRDECRSMFRPDKHCLERKSEVPHCPTSKNCTDEDLECQKQSDNKCAYKFKPSKSPGVIVCRHPHANLSSTNLSIARTYIVTQDNNIYFGVDGSQKDELNLTIVTNYKDKNKTCVYKNDTEVQFICKGTSSFYMFGFRYVLEYNDTNGTMVKVDLGPGDEKLDTDNEFLYTVTKNITFNESTISNKNVTVSCFAPMWDSFEWKSKSISFEVKEPTDPNITNFIGKCNYNGSIYVEITCTAKGDPKPTFEWFWGDGDKKTLVSNRLLSNNMKNAYEKEEYQIKTVEQENGEVTSIYRILHDLIITFNPKKNAITKLICEAKNFKSKSSIRGTEKSWITDNSSQCNLYTDTDDKLYLYLAIGFLTAGFLVSIVIGIYYTKRIRNKNGLDPDEIEAFTNGGDPAQFGDDAFIRPYKLEFEIPRNEITLTNDVIGEGEFAKVVFGTYKYQKVAVKMVKRSANVNHFKAFLLEIKTMCYIEKHPNLVNIVGACTRRIKQREVLLVVEYCSNGNLLKYLKKSQNTFIDLSGPEELGQKKNRLRTLRGTERRKVSVIGSSISTINLLTWAVQCASAMEFLSFKRIVHGDLAARNVLLTEQLHAKVGDFGLSKQLSEYSVYVQTLTCPLPLRWMSLEALQDLEFSIQSDIWSFGVLLWEIFSLGQLPYPGIPQWDFQSYIFLQSGHRMEKPKYSNESIYTIMRDCWEENPEKRPPFEKLKERLIAELIALQC